MGNTMPTIQPAASFADRERRERNNQYVIQNKCVISGIGKPIFMIFIDATLSALFLLDSFCSTYLSIYLSRCLSNSLILPFTSQGACLQSIIREIPTPIPTIRKKNECIQKLLWIHAVFPQRIVHANQFSNMYVMREKGAKSDRWRTRQKSVVKNIHKKRKHEQDIHCLQLCHDVDIPQDTPNSILANTRACFRSFFVLFHEQHV